jgi:hypothetical protein
MSYNDLRTTYAVQLTQRFSEQSAVMTGLNCPLLLILDTVTSEA